jgi:hypothetical protein
MATSRLANILQQEYKTKGLIGGAASSLGKRSLEKLDIRNALFSGGGVGSVIGTKIFGKGYSATRKNDASSASQTTSPDALGSGSSSILQDINTNGKITAKNSMALPSMAKQMNIMQKNIAKLVTIWGGKPTSKADSFFSNAKFRENQYESQFKAGDKQPTKVEGKEKSGGLLGLIGPIISLIGGVISAFASKISAIVASVGILSGVFTALGVAAAGLSGVFKRILQFFIRSPIGRLLGLAAVAGAALGASSGANAGTIDTPNIGGEETDQNKPSMGEKIGQTAGAVALGAIGVNSIKKSLTPPAKTPGALTQLGDVGAKRAAAQTKWGKFLIWLERKAPRLFARIGVKLAAMGGLAAIPIAGWIGAIISAGFLIWDAYYVYQLWTEYNGSPESKDSESDTAATSPTILEESNADANGNITGVTPASTTPTSSPIRGATSTSASTTPAKVDLPKGGSISSNEAIDYLVKKHGLTPAQAAGVVGNLVQESGLKSGAHNENSKENSYGLAQWNAKAGRLQKLAAYASSQGKDLGDPKMQLDYLMHELNTDPSLGGKELRGAQTAEEAANIFATKFERPQTVEPVRMKYAAKALAEYKPSTGGGSDSTMVAQYDANGSFTGYGESPSSTSVAPKINGPAVATASAAKESAAANKPVFSSADMADILSVIGGPKTSGSSSGSGMNQVVSTSKSTPYHSDFYSNLVRTQAL